MTEEEILISRIRDDIDQVDACSERIREIESGLSNSSRGDVDRERESRTSDERLLEWWNRCVDLECTECFLKRSEWRRCRSSDDRDVAHDALNVIR